MRYRATLLLDLRTVGEPVELELGDDVTTRQPFGELACEIIGRSVTMFGENIFPLDAIGRKLTR